MSRHKMPLNSAYMLVKKKRPIVSPNPTFMRILEQFEYDLYRSTAQHQQQQNIYRNPKIYTTQAALTGTKKNQGYYGQEGQENSGNTAASATHIPNNKQMTSSSNVEYNYKPKSYRAIETGNKVSLYSIDDLYDVGRKRLSSAQTSAKNNINNLKHSTIALPKKSNSGNPLNPYILADSEPFASKKHFIQISSNSRTDRSPNK
jgi:hypothetical protein